MLPDQENIPVLSPGALSGMSFELRFGGKPINPDRWLLPGL
jgi:hypothetical protein